MEFKYTGKDGHRINVYKWEANKPKAILQIVHGMAEHAARYENFAKFLNKEGITVYADDHRGHGKTSEAVDKQGRIGKDGFNGMVEDEKKLTDLIKNENPKIPIILMGHSMGSFLSQEYITKYGDGLDGVILSGTSGKFGGDVKGGRLLAGLQMIFLGGNAKAKLVEKISFGPYTKRIENLKSDKDWVNRDQKEVAKYIEDPYCGAIFPLRFYYELFGGFINLHNKDKIESIPKKLPIYIFAGEADPVGKYGKGIKNLYEMYKELGIKNLNMKLYPGGRHEMLNEINKKEVYQDVLNWLKKRY